MIDDEERPPTEEELRAAAALAEALEGRAAAGPVPQDALEAAALLRAGARPPELDARTAEVQRAQLSRRVVAPLPRVRRWPVVAGGLAAAAAVAFAVLAQPRPAPPGLPLPPPPAALLRAQLQAAHGGPGQDGELDAQLHRYREALYAELERRHREHP